tara:strand:- start:599 stop:784 length:186 start_codon:yes stop_codon:yes gene_type:complete
MFSFSNPSGRETQSSRLIVIIDSTAVAKFRTILFQNIIWRVLRNSAGAPVEHFNNNARVYN